MTESPNYEWVAVKQGLLELRGYQGDIVQIQLKPNGVRPRFTLITGMSESDFYTLPLAKSDGIRYAEDTAEFDII